jgi:hypothetical protein
MKRKGKKLYEGKIKNELFYKRKVETLNKTVCSRDELKAMEALTTQTIFCGTVKWKTEENIVRMTIILLQL